MSAGTRLNIGVHYARASHFSNFDWSSNFDSYRVRNVAVAATQNHSTGVPDDFLSLIALYVVFIPNAGAAGTITVSTTWGPRGGADNARTGGPTAVGYAAGSGSILTALDFAAALGASAGLIAAGDCIGLGVTNTAGQTCSFLYSELVYTRKAS